MAKHTHLVWLGAVNLSLAQRVLHWPIQSIRKNQLLNCLEVACARHLSSLPVCGFESLISGSVRWSLSTCKRKFRARLRYWQISTQLGLLRRGEKNYRCVCPRADDGHAAPQEDTSQAPDVAQSQLFRHGRLIRSVMLGEVKKREVPGEQAFRACAPSRFISGIRAG